MKKIVLGLFVLVLSISLFSCSKNSEQINVAKNEIEKKLSDIEKKDINYTCIEMSDREAYKEIENYHEKILEKSKKEYDEFEKKYELGKYQITPLEEMETYEIKNYLKMLEFDKSYLDEITENQNVYGNDIKELSKLKGENTYYKVLAVKTSPDTIIHKKIYLDNNNKIIINQNLK